MTKSFTLKSDAVLHAYRELDDALGLTDLMGDALFDPRTGRNGRQALTGLFRQSIFGRLVSRIAIARRQAQPSSASA